MNRLARRVVTAFLLFGAAACNADPDDPAAAGGGGGLSGHIYWVSSADLEIHRLDVASGEDVVLGPGGAVSRAADGKLIIIGKNGVEESDESLVSSRLIKDNNADSTDRADSNQIVPTISPDGTKIAYETLSGNSYVCSRADGAVTARFEQASVTGGLLNPSWTPDGRLVLAGGFSNPGLYLTDAALTTVTRFDPNLDQPQYPAVSPDGTKVAFVLKKLVYTIGIDGAGLEQLDTTTDSADDTFPTWNPAGTHIAYFARAGRLKIRPAAGGGEIDLFDVYPALAQKFLVISSTTRMQWTD